MGIATIGDPDDRFEAMYRSRRDLRREMRIAAAMVLISPAHMRRPLAIARKARAWA